jgi:hypothetical protein
MPHLGCTPAPEPSPRSAVLSGTAEGTTTDASGEAVQMVSLRVPSMHCVFSCWPKVKKELEQQEGVVEVTLAEQAKEDELDNPVVYLRLDGDFD